MSPVTPAILLTCAEAGPATLMTTGARSSSPSASRTPATRPPCVRISATARAEAEAAAMRLGGALQVVRRKRRVGDIAGRRKEDAALYAAARRLAEAGSSGRFGGLNRERSMIGRRAGIRSASQSS